ncbi:hypothetical protein PIROE2DRAFT_3585 [Piromyces sp. E2]|nr:hypothetical protein PIROE2DRAFT_3585 [Piromyces sp. E2]|eukprot:OUM68603.1 hypothetical protein PIROE2DRAFT_3585 [Piromyces sp. E2]
MTQLSYSYSDKSANILVEQKHELKEPTNLGYLAEEIEKLKRLRKKKLNRK